MTARRSGDDRGELVWRFPPDRRGGARRRAEHVDPRRLGLRRLRRRRRGRGGQQRLRLDRPVPRRGDDRHRLRLAVQPAAGQLRRRPVPASRRAGHGGRGPRAVHRGDEFDGGRLVAGQPQRRRLRGRHVPAIRENAQRSLVLAAVEPLQQRAKRRHGGRGHQRPRRLEHLHRQQQRRRRRHRHRRRLRQSRPRRRTSGRIPSGPTAATGSPATCTATTSSPTTAT